MNLVRFYILHPSIITMVAWMNLLFLAGCVEVQSQSKGNMKQQAEKAIKDVGGPVALENEAKVIMNNFQVGLDWKTISNNGTNCPAITKMHALLSPYGHVPWVVQDKNELPAHIVIRFGSHRHYEYVWIFDPAHMPLGKIAGVEHLSGSVYLSKKNE
jgi:Cu/Ag efflux pump CusA